MKSHNLRWTSVMAILISVLMMVSVEPGLASSEPIQMNAPWQGAESTVQAMQSSALTRIRFATGATSAVVSGNLAAHKTARFVLTANAGQLMDVTLSAPDGVRLTVSDSDGRVLTALTTNSAGFRGYLPRNGDYVLAVKAGSQSVSYSLSVSIPVRISFARGATSASLTGRLSAHHGLDYILGAQANQLMEIDASPDSRLQLVIFGVDGTVLRSGMGQGASFRDPLPLSEDYFVSLRAGDKAVSFTMKVIIPQRITFQPGTISGSVQHSLQANHTQYYVLRALKNQTMKVRLSSSDESQLIIYGADGTLLKGESSSGSSFTGKLPRTQDYVVAVEAREEPVQYKLKVTIQ